MTLMATRIDAATRLRLKLGEKGKEVHLEYNMTATVKVDNSRRQGDIFVNRAHCLASPSLRPARHKLLKAVSVPLVEDIKQYGFPELDTQVPVVLLIKVCPKEGRQLSARNNRYPLFAAQQDWISRASDNRRGAMEKVCKFLKTALLCTQERRAKERQKNPPSRVSDEAWATYLDGAMDRASLDTLSTGQAKGATSSQHGGAAGRPASRTEDTWGRRAWQDGGPAKRSKGTSGAYGAQQRWNSSAKRQKGGASSGSAGNWQ